MLPLWVVKDFLLLNLVNVAWMAVKDSVGKKKKKKEKKSTSLETSYFRCRSSVKKTVRVLIMSMLFRHRMCGQMRWWPSRKCLTAESSPLRYDLHFHHPDYNATFILEC